MSSGPVIVKYELFDLIWRDKRDAVIVPVPKKGNSNSGEESAYKMLSGRY